MTWPKSSQNENHFRLKSSPPHEPGLGRRSRMCLLERHPDAQRFFGRNQLIEVFGVFVDVDLDLVSLILFDLLSLPFPWAAK
jgi:hypothetical protein